MTPHKIVYVYPNVGEWPSPTGLKELKAAYKQHQVAKRKMRWGRFPLSHTWAPVAQPVPYYYRTSRPSASMFMTFEAQLEALEVESFADPYARSFAPNQKEKKRPKGMPVPQKEMWRHKSSLDYLIHTFCAPFSEVNANLFAVQGVEVFLRGDPARVLCDKALETGLQVGTDFTFQEMSRYIVPVSDTMRLFLQEESRGPFQGLLEVVVKSVNPVIMSFDFVLEELEEAKPLRRSYP